MFWRWGDCNSISRTLAINTGIKKGILCAWRLICLRHSHSELLLYSILVIFRYFFPFPLPHVPGKIVNLKTSVLQESPPKKLDSVNEEKNVLTKEWITEKQIVFSLFLSVYASYVCLNSLCECTLECLVLFL